jgi:hypothetical protein
VTIDVDNYTADVVEILNKNTNWQWKATKGNHDRHRWLVTAAGHRWGLVHLNGNLASGGTFEVRPDLGQEVIPGGDMVHQQWWRNNMRDATEAESRMIIKVGAKTRPQHLAGQIRDSHPFYRRDVGRYEAALAGRVESEQHRSALHARTVQACGDHKMDTFDDSVFWQPLGKSGLRSVYCNVNFSMPWGEDHTVDVKGTLPHGAVMAVIAALNEWQAAQQQ